MSWGCFECTLLGSVPAVLLTPQLTPQRLLQSTGYGLGFAWLSSTVTFILKTDPISVLSLLPHGIWNLWVLSPLPPLSRAGTFVLYELILKLLTCLKVRYLLLFSLINILLFKNVCGNCLILLVTALPSDMFNRAGGRRQAPPSLQPISIYLIESWN